jgi:hypothetical protein
MTLDPRVGRSRVWEDETETIAKFTAVATPVEFRTHIGMSTCPSPDVRRVAAALDAAHNRTFVVDLKASEP